jgi:hypothetical protein
MKYVLYLLLAALFLACLSVFLYWGLLIYVGD